MRPLRIGNQISCAFTLGTLVGALVPHAKHMHGSKKKRPKIQPVLAQDVSENGDATLHWGMNALVVTCDREMVGIFSRLFHEIHIETYNWTRVPARE